MVGLLVLSRLDFGNATLTGAPAYLLERLQSVMNAAARLIFSSSRFDHISPLLSRLHWLKAAEWISYKVAVLAYHGTNVNTVWRRLTCLMNYDVQQTLKSDNDCIPPHQYLWPFDALGCLPSATERFLSRPPVCGTVFHRMSPLLHPCPFFVLVLNPICFLFLILVSDSLHFLLVQCLRSDFVISDTIIVITLDIRHFPPCCVVSSDAD